MSVRRIRKLVGTVLGAVTAGAVIGAFALFDVTIGTELAAAIVTILAAAGTWVAPPNEA